MGLQLDWQLLILVASFIGILLAYLYFTRSYNYWKKRGIVYETPIVFCGNLKDALFVKKSIREVVTSLYWKHKNEKVVGIYSFNQPVLLIRDLDIIYQVMVNDFNSFPIEEKFFTEEIDPVFGMDWFLLQADRWEMEITKPAFSMPKIKSIYPQILSIADSLTDYIGNHPEELMLFDLFGRYTSEVVVGSGLGIQGHAFTQKDPPFHCRAKVPFAPKLWYAIKLFVFIAVPSLGRFFKKRFSSENMADLFTKAVRDEVYRRESKNESRNDILQYFIDIKRESVEVEKGTIKSDIIRRPLNDEDIIIGMLTFYLDGYETTARSLVHIFYELAKNPDVQDKVRKEIFDEEKNVGSQWSLDKLLALPVLSNTISETLRLHSGHYITRMCMKDTKIDISENQSLRFEKGSVVYIPVRGIHTDPKYWEDPEIFNPDRFNKDETLARPRGTFMPFGQGPRLCIGMTIAQVIMKAAVVKILRMFEVVRTERTPEKFQEDPTSFTVTHKGGIYVKFQKLKQ